MSSYNYCDENPCKNQEYGEITSNVLEIDFEKVAEYKVSATKQITLTNTSDTYKALLIKISVFGDFEVNVKSFPSIFEPGQKFTFTVRFTPIAIGVVNGSIQIEQKNHDPIIINLTGEGVHKTNGSSSGEGGEEENPDEPSEGEKGLTYWEDDSVTFNGGYSGSVLIPKTNSENKHAVIKPKGTGGFTLSSFGSNRGNYSVDLQINNSSSGSNALGEYSVISGGRNNKAAGNYSTISGGSENQVLSSYGVIGGGNANKVQGTYLTIGGGQNNTLFGTNNTISGGNSNSIGSNTDDFTNSFIGSGSNLSILGNSSAIISGNSVQLSGSNSFIGSGEELEVSGNSIGVISGNSSTITGSNEFIGLTFDTTYSGENSYIFSGISSNLKITSGNTVFSGISLDSILTNVQKGFFGTVSNVLVSNSEYSGIILGINNTMDTSNNSIIIAGQENTLDNSSSSLDSSYENSYALIASGYKNKVLSGKQSSIVNGNKNIINGVYYSTILGGTSNEILYGTSFEKIEEACVITGGQNNVIQASTESSIDGGRGNFIDSSDHSNIVGGSDNTILNSETSVTISGTGNSINNGQYAISAGGTRNKISGVATGSIGGIRNVLSARNSVALGGEYGSDLGIKNHTFTAIRDGVSWIKKIVAEDTGAATEEDADNDLSVWVNNNPVFQKGEIILQKMIDPTKGTYEGTADYKCYLLTQTKKYQHENIWYNMPNNEENNTIYIPEYTCVFWEMEVSLVDFSSGKAAKIICSKGIISDTDEGLKIIQAHTKEVYGEESLNNCDVTVELDTENSLVRFLLPQEVKNYVGGAVFKYTIATQGSTNFYWGN